MLGVMGISAAFAQAAGAHARKNETILRFSENDPGIVLSCDGKIIVRSTSSGDTIEETYENLELSSVSITADSETDVVIIGDITELKIDQTSVSYYKSKNDALQELKVFETDIKQLDLRGNENLRIFDCNSCTGLTALDLSANTALQQINCSGCTGLTALDLSANTALQQIDCSGCTGLTALDLSANTALQQINCSGCTGLTALDLSANTALQQIYCGNCTGLTALDLSANTALQQINCGNCTGLTALDLSANTALQQINCSGCTGLTALDLSANTALQQIDCSGCTGLTALDLSANTALQQIYCRNCTGLTDIYYPAINSNVSTAIAGAITNATASDGTVYTDSAAAYYSTIRDAATAKGWTIEQLQ